MRSIAKLGTIALVTAVILGMSSSAVYAQTLWKGWASGTSQAYDEQQDANSFPFYTVYDNFDGWGGGQLGNFTAQGDHSFTPDLGLFGQAALVCSDGATLFVSYEGQYIITEDQDFPYLFTATMTATGGTGRLAHVTGSADMNGGFAGIHGEFYFEFEGMLNAYVNFHEFGIMEIESLAMGKGQTVPYTMESWNPITGETHHTGSIMPTSEPVVDESVPGMTIWTFSAEQGPNPNYFGNPVHVMAAKDGVVFVRWEAQCRIEIDHNNDGAARLWFDGCFTAMGGTNRYEDASGVWQTQFATEPCFGDDPNWCVYMMNGTLQVDKIQSVSTADILFNTQKTK